MGAGVLLVPHRAGRGRRALRHRQRRQEHRVQRALRPLLRRGRQHHQLGGRTLNIDVCNVYNIVFVLYLDKCIYFLENEYLQACQEKLILLNWLQSQDFCLFRCNNISRFC